jgi:hypothetical protein
MNTHDESFPGPEGPPLAFVELPVPGGVELLIYDPGSSEPAETAFIPDEHDEQEGRATLPRRRRRERT